MMIRVRKLCLALFGVGLLGVFVGIGSGNAAIWSPSSVVAVIGLAIGLGAVPALAGFQFTAWIVATVVVGMNYPMAVLNWGDFDLRNPVLLLIAVQMVMFGVGTQMSLRDFAGVLKMPWGVIVAVVSQFSIMPLLGFLLTKLFTMPDEVAAGVILIGCCSSGVASNVMCYLARANLALSITATAVTTMLAPIMTPMWMKILAGTLVEVSFFNMMIQIIKIIVVPIGATMLHDYLKFAGPRGRRVVYTGALAGTVWMVFLLIGGYGWVNTTFEGDVLAAVTVGGFLLGAFTAGALYHQLAVAWPAVDRILPRLSMCGILYFTTVTTAAGRDQLLVVGGLLFLVGVLHNGFGYVLGYWAGRAGGLDRASCRAVAIEVGLQNGGMAAGIAGMMGKLGTVGLAATVFGAWMNISGSFLATYWARRPVTNGVDRDDLTKVSN